MGHIFGTDILLWRLGQRGMLAIEAYHQLKKPVLTVEIGGRYGFKPEFINQGIRGLFNILTYLKLLSGKLKLPQKQYILKERSGWTSPFNGILDLKVKLGDKITDKQTIAQIYNPLTNQQTTITADEDGIIFSINPKERVSQGEHIASLLVTNNHNHHHCHILKVIHNH